MRPRHKRGLFTIPRIVAGSLSLLAGTGEAAEGKIQQYKADARHVFSVDWKKLGLSEPVGKVGDLETGECLAPSGSLSPTFRVAVSKRDYRLLLFE